ncbi:MAG: DNA polymerase I [Hyphomicrobiaceae bacterium]|nr:DNA polymerase I [Hyphomicrobiaceae bacterium]
MDHESETAGDGTGRTVGAAVTPDHAGHGSNAAPSPHPDAERSNRTSTVPSCEPLPIAKGSHVYLIDGSGYIFRAFHALPPLTRPSDGLPVGAVHGFCQMLWKLIGDSRMSDKPTHIAVIFDAGRETFRNKIYDKYKAQRPPPPDELIPQFGLIRDATAAFNIACLEQDGYEADDLIATYARLVTADGGDVTIVSSDKDLMQLIRPGVVMLDGMKAKRIGRDEVIEKFGVPPEKVVDVQSLAGDSVDNVPGVPGIGVKTAAELITTYGDLDALLAKAGEIKQPKRRENLIAFADQARISRELVRLKDDVPIQFAPDCLGVQEPKPTALLGFLQAMEFNTLTQKIAVALGSDPPPRLTVSVGASVRAKSVDAGGEAAEPTGGAATGVGVGTPQAGARWHHERMKAIPFDRKAYETVTTVDQLNRWIGLARDSGHCAITVMTSNSDPMTSDLIGIAIAVVPGRACYVPLRHAAGSGFDFGNGIAQIGSADALAALTPLLEDASLVKIGHNIKFAMLVLSVHGIAVAPVDDVMLLSYALDGGRWSHGLDDLALRHLGHACLPFDKVLEHAPAPLKGAKKSDRVFAAVPLPEATQYAGENADTTLRLWHVLRPRLVPEAQTVVYETLERPLLPVLVAMEYRGIKADPAILSRLSAQFAQNTARLEDEIFGLVGVKFHLGSPKQLGELLFDTLKLPGGKRTKSGQWETRAGLLDDLAENEELPEDARALINKMLEWRQLTKLRTTYTDALPHYLDGNSRIHTNYALASTTTGRLSSTEPNLQNIPIRTKEGREIRTAFIAEPGHKIVSADYSQIELRILAHIADIPQLKRAFAEGLDIHAMTASEMFGVPVEGMPGEVRRRAKAINFGIIYGISAFGLANQLGIPREEAGEYIKTYFKRFPGIRDYMEGTKRFCRDNGYVETIFGRRIHYPEINTRNPGVRGNLERAAINAPIQGSAADIIRRAMIRMPDAITSAGLGSARMLLQVHDELVFEVADKEATRLVEIATAVMERAPMPAVEMAVPVKVDAKAAANWEAAH